MSCCEGRGCSHCNSPERREINRVANLLIAEWERVEKKPVNISYYATFADMARVVIADRDKLTGTCFPCDGVGYTGEPGSWIACEVCDCTGLRK